MIGSIETGISSQDFGKVWNVFGPQCTYQINDNVMNKHMTIKNQAGEFDPWGRRL